jgi:hypothetical protein
MSRQQRCPASSKWLPVRKLAQRDGQDLTHPATRDTFLLGELLDRRVSLFPTVEPEALDDETTLAPREMVEQERRLRPALSRAEGRPKCNSVTKAVEATRARRSATG